jgi:hypothetical protein
MRRINTKSAGLENHVGKYNRVDARLDNPHTPDRELDSIVRKARLEDNDRHIPLRQRIKVA